MSRAFVIAAALALGATLVSLAVYAWSASESLHFYGQMRRCVRIGLAEERTARRFLLWGVSAGAAVGMHLASMIARAILGSGNSHPVLMATTSPLGLVAAISLWLAFFPRRRAAPIEATAR